MQIHREERRQSDVKREVASKSRDEEVDIERQMANTVNTGEVPAPTNTCILQFEADSEDEGMEREINNNIDSLYSAAKRLGQLSRKCGEEIEKQSQHIVRITGKADKVADQVALNSANMKQIR
jgi:DNA-binding transcriptional regulator WhiA